MKSLLTRREEARALRLARSQPESVGEFNEFMEEMAERVVGAVLAEDRVRSRLDGVRHAVVAADYREDKSSDEEPGGLRQAEVGIYDYERDVLVVAVVDLRQGELVELTERPGTQPPITSEELEAAMALAHEGDRASSRRNGPGRSVVALPTSSFSEGQARAGHRCATLYISSGARRGWEEITVDLSAQEVVPKDELIRGSARAAQDFDRGS